MPSGPLTRSARLRRPIARVIRDALEAAIPARDVVSGDVILLRAGDRVPADSRLTQAINLAVDESALTGESAAVEKTTAALGRPDLPLGDRTNMVYAGTSWSHGRGQAVVVATGMSTEFGHIARMVDMVEAGRTPLQENLDRLGATLGKAALAVVALVVVLGLARGLPPIEMLMFGIALAVAVVPEALPAVVTISLAIGVRRMVKRRALVRRLPVVETLGSTSVICSDKTGTLTKNEMTVRQVWTGGRLYEFTGAGYDPVGEVRLSGTDAVTPPRVARGRAARSRVVVGCATGWRGRVHAGRGRPDRRGAARRRNEGGVVACRRSSRPRRGSQRFRFPPNAVG